MQKRGSAYCCRHSNERYVIVNYDNCDALTRKLPLA